MDCPQPQRRLVCFSRLPAATSGASALPRQNRRPQPLPLPGGSFHGTDMRKEDIGGDFTMTDGDGKPFTLSSLKGKAVILAFGYTHCPDICPTELLTYSDALKQLGEQAEDVAVIFASVDPRARHAGINRQICAPIQPGLYRPHRYPAIRACPLSSSNTAWYRPRPASDPSRFIWWIIRPAPICSTKEGEVAVFAPYGTTATQIADDLKILLK